MEDYISYIKEFYLNVVGYKEFERERISERVREFYLNVVGYKAG